MNKKTIEFINSIKKDKSAMILLLSNILAIIFALTQQWDLLIIMSGYWLQSVIIGFFNFVRIINLKDFSVKDIKVNDKLIKATKKTKIYIAFFFAFHYGFFHFGYLSFLISFMGEKGMSIMSEIYPLLLIGIIFFLNHLFSFWYNRKEPEGRKPNIGKIMLFPYIRIIPMHLAIMAYGAFTIFSRIAGFELYLIPLVLFLVLKTFSDLAMHIAEHNKSKYFDSVTEI